MKLISNKLYEQYTKTVIGFHQYIPNITKEQLYEVFKFHCANLRVLNEVVEYYSELQEENQQLKEQLQQKDEIINKAKEFVCDYKKQWVVNDEVVDDMEVLLKILDNKGE